jgi:HEPN domain-containing protein
VEEYKLLMERSTMYLEEARETLDKSRCDISVSLAEQGLQLFLKAQLLRVLGDYPRTHSVRGS